MPTVLEDRARRYNRRMTMATRKKAKAKKSTKSSKAKKGEGKKSEAAPK